MPSDKAAYLAAHYLTADSKPTKKRKRKHASKGDGLLIADDNDDWGTGSSSRGRNRDDEDDDGPAVVSGTSSEFRKSKKSSWKTVGAPIPTDTKDKRDAAEAAADAVLAAAAAEVAAARDQDDAPVVADEDGDIEMLADGTHAGLQTAASVTAQQEKRREREREELARLEAERKAAGDQDDEVVMRDATGRRIDVSMRRAEARRAALEAEKAELAKARLLKGEVQAEQAKARREALEDAALMPLARGADDEEMNRELKAEERWNDPMAQFIAEGGSGGTGKKKGGAAGRRPVYKGAAPPNRYGIKPGYRWDGVDRGNGFEAERFKAINRRERNKALDYSWQQDV
ncbi:hypothetical protein GQ53DRAFT_187171 [Thozetella sp. PMI_491]|nr:hypothetical protein GQ53DRAFT_187171 [Thozetella sp. PMI_491]